MASLDKQIKVLDVIESRNDLNEDDRRILLCLAMLADENGAVTMENDGGTMTTIQITCLNGGAI